MGYSESGYRCQQGENIVNDSENEFCIGENEMAEHRPRKYQLGMQFPKCVDTD